MYAGVAKIFARYWAAYGGCGALVRSPYFHLSVIFTAVTYRLWSAPNWWEFPLQVMPSILGFSLGGYAIWLAIGDQRFRALIAGVDSEGTTSPFMVVNAAFVHFILLQFLSILFAVVFAAFAPAEGDGMNVALKVISSVGFFLFLYALLAAVAALMTIFRVASWYEAHIECASRSDKDSGNH